MAAQYLAWKRFKEEKEKEFPRTYKPSEESIQTKIEHYLKDPTIKEMAFHSCENIKGNHSSDCFKFKIQVKDFDKPDTASGRFMSDDSMKDLIKKRINKKEKNCLKVKDKVDGKKTNVCQWVKQDKIKILNNSLTGKRYLDFE